MAIIKSLLDNDLYTYTVGQMAIHQFNNTQVKYEFKCRNTEALRPWTHHMVLELKDEVQNFCNLRFTPEELDYLRSIRFLKDDYIDFLGLYQPNPEHISVTKDHEELEITVHGPWYLTIFFEVPVLAMVNEIYFKYYGQNNKKDGRTLLEKKIALANYNGIYFSDFGTRRRYSAEWQREVVEYCAEHATGFNGTSNVLLAKDLGLKPIGTMSHQAIMVGAGQEDVRLAKSQAYMLQKWVDEYRGDLGIALTDTYGFDAFLNDFDLYFAKLYDGLRHDSGDPITWADKAIAHYVKLGIDPMTKTLVFSDGLNMEKAVEIAMYLEGSINVSFGIGTNLTNDFTGQTPMQIVMKIVSCNGAPVAKISDSKGKGMCKDAEYIKYVKKVFKIS